MRLGRATGRLVATQAVAQEHIVQHAEPGQQQVALRHVGDGSGRLAAWQQPCEMAQERRLADTAAAQQAGRPATGEIE
jgi:hypothetical protein